MSTEGMPGSTGPTSHQMGPVMSRFRGVSWCPDRRKWYVEITAGGKRHRGSDYYDNEHEAARAYDIVAKQLHEYPLLNFKADGNVNHHRTAARYIAPSLEEREQHRHAILTKKPLLSKHQGSLRPRVYKRYGSAIKEPGGPNSSIYRGVTRRNQVHKKWQAQISVKGKYKSLGSYDREIDAARAYDRAARMYHECPVLNFPDEHDYDDVVHPAQQAPSRHAARRRRRSSDDDDDDDDESPYSEMDEDELDDDHRGSGGKRQRRGGKRGSSSTSGGGGSYHGGHGSGVPMGMGGMGTMANGNNMSSMYHHRRDAPLGGGHSEMEHSAVLSALASMASTLLPPAQRAGKRVALVDDRDIGVVVASDAEDGCDPHTRAHAHAHAQPHTHSAARAHAGVQSLLAALSAAQAMQRGAGLGAYLQAPLAHAQMHTHTPPPPPTHTTLCLRAPWSCPVIAQDGYPLQQMSQQSPGVPPLHPQLPLAPHAHPHAHTHFDHKWRTNDGRGLSPHTRPLFQQHHHRQAQAAFQQQQQMRQPPTHTSSPHHTAHTPSHPHSHSHTPSFRPAPTHSPGGQGATPVASGGVTSRVGGGGGITRSDSTGAANLDDVCPPAAGCCSPTHTHTHTNNNRHALPTANTQHHSPSMHSAAHNGPAHGSESQSAYPPAPLSTNGDDFSTNEKKGSSSTLSVYHGSHGGGGGGPRVSSHSEDTSLWYPCPSLHSAHRHAPPPQPPRPTPPPSEQHTHDKVVKPAAAMAVEGEEGEEGQQQQQSSTTQPRPSETTKEGLGVAAANRKPEVKVEGSGGRPLQEKRGDDDDDIIGSGGHEEYDGTGTPQQQQQQGGDTGSPLTGSSPRTSSSASAAAAQEDAGNHHDNHTHSSSAPRTLPLASNDNSYDAREDQRLSSTHPSPRQAMDASTCSDGGGGGGGNNGSNAGEEREEQHGGGGDEEGKGGGGGGEDGLSRLSNGDGGGRCGGTTKGDVHRPPPHGPPSTLSQLRPFTTHTSSSPLYHTQTQTPTPYLLTNAHNAHTLPTHAQLSASLLNLLKPSHNRPRINFGHPNLRHDSTYTPLPAHTPTHTAAHTDTTTHTHTHMGASAERWRQLRNPASQPPEEPSGTNGLATENEYQAAFTLLGMARR